MDLRECYTELVRHANGGLSRETEIKVLIEGRAAAVSHLYYNGRDLIVFLSANQTDRAPARREEKEEAPAE